VIPNYNDTAAQASFAAKTAFLVDGMVPLLSHRAFSDIFEEQGYTWDVFNGTLPETTPSLYSQSGLGSSL
jgi:hypothetical protein